MILFIYISSYFILEIIGLANYEQKKWLDCDTNYYWYFEELNPFTTDLEVKTYLGMLFLLPLACLIRLFLWIFKN